MIKRVKVILSFPEGAYFNDNVNIAIYRYFISFIKDLMCFNIQSTCKDCIKKQQCRYHKLTGNNFSEYPGVLIRNLIFDKKHFEKNDTKEFNFYFIGNNEIYTDYVELFFEQLHQNLFGQFFYLKTIQIDTLVPTNQKLIDKTCLTPIESNDFSQSYNEMIQYYNTNYMTSFQTIKDGIILSHVRNVKWNKIALKTRSIYVKGFVGKITDPVQIDNQILEIGIGKFNFIGGGHIEIKT